MSQAVHDMFADIAPKYDWANDVLSFGIHRLWRTRALRLLQLKPDSVLVDVCTGTGDVAFAAAKLIGSKGRVIGVDFVYQMLSLAQQKMSRERGASAMQFVHGDALSLPLPDNTADACSVSFGIRNVDDPLAGLIEMKRVVRPSGKVLVIEFGQVTLPIFAQLYSFYSKYIMPLLGQLLTGNRAAYQYLPETAASFPAGAAFTALMDQAGLRNIQAIPLLFGLAYIYVGEK